jgi:citrate synthase
MVNTRLTTEQAARLLGVKPATLYAYVSRGLLQRERTPEGSTFDAREVARLAHSGRRPPRDEAAGTGTGTAPAGPDLSGSSPSNRPSHPTRRREPDEPVFVTELTLIEDGRLYYRALDAVELSRTCRFEDVAVWLWSGAWPEPDEVWPTPPGSASAVAAALGSAGTVSLPIERLMIATVTAGLSDDLRHDLNPGSVPVVGRRLLPALVDALPLVRPHRAGGREGADGSLAARLWPRLSRLPLTPERQAVLDAALVLVADHELAPSTLAARVAAALRADPYAVVSTGMGPASGSWFSGSSGAPSEVESLLADALVTDPERAIGARLRRSGATPHGFGMPLYPDGDPRGAELLARLDQVSGRSERHAVVDRVRRIAAERAFPPPNVDLGLGALSFCAEMIPGAGQAISTIGKAAGWLAHAMEEYASPTLFRIRGDYIGPRPGGGASVSREGDRPGLGDAPQGGRPARPARPGRPSRPARSDRAGGPGLARRPRGPA